jgi:hypothetical protein
MDIGTLHAANFMRPVSKESAFASYYENSGTEYIQHFENRPYILRQIVAGVLGGLLYLGVIFGMLRWMQRDRVLILRKAKEKRQAIAIV